MKKLTELQEQKLQRVMQEYDEAMRKFNENRGRGELKVSTWGWMVGILIPIALAVLILKMLLGPIYDLLRFVDYVF